MTVYYDHIAALIKTLNPHPTKILDAGCGAGKLVGILHDRFQCEVHGYDISDPHGPGYHQKALGYLNQKYPEVDWNKRLHIMHSMDKLPLEDNQFDFVVSNQVIEHVFDFDHFISETSRIIRPGGYAIHVFPVRDSLWEGHVLQPLSHWIPSVWWIKFWLTLGIGKRTKSAEEWVEYLHSKTCYRGLSDILIHFPHADISYSGNAIWQKFGHREAYTRPLWMTFLFKRFISVTLLLPKPTVS